jgi:hypothetical protein
MLSELPSTVVDCDGIDKRPVGSSILASRYCPHERYQILRSISAKSNLDLNPLTRLQRARGSTLSGFAVER